MSIKNKEKLYTHWDILRFLSEDDVGDSCIALADYGQNGELYDLMVYLFKEGDSWSVYVYNSEGESEYGKFTFSKFKRALGFVDDLPYNHPEYRNRPRKKVVVDKSKDANNSEGNIKIIFEATFGTDGDFSFDRGNLKSLFDKESSLYKGAKIEYMYIHDDGEEDIHIRFKAEGESYPCRYALRDLLEALMCSISTIKYWLVKDIYDLLEYFHEDVFGDLPQEKSKGLSGNYDGTWLSLKMYE